MTTPRPTRKTSSRHSAHTVPGSSEPVLREVEHGLVSGIAYPTHSVFYAIPYAAAAHRPRPLPGARTA
jgi:hypothetical protein